MTRIVSVKSLHTLFNLILIVVLAVGSIYFITKQTTTSSTSSVPSPSVPANNGAAVSSIRIAGNHFINANGQEIKLIGVDATGTEDACIQNAGFSWYTLNNAQAKYIAGWHADAVRVPLNEDCWLGINGSPAAYSGAAYRQQIEQWVNDLNNNGMYVILDLHWTAPAGIQANQQWPMADSDHSLTFWQQVAQAFKNDHAVLFDVFNEPFLGNRTPTASNWACWLNGCSYNNNCLSGKKGCTPAIYQTAGEQQLINVIRQTGATQPIEISGLDWSNDPCGLYMKGGNGGNCMILKEMPHDPANQLALSSHLYYTSECHTLNCFNKDQLIVSKKIPVVIDEFGEKDCKVSFVNAVMNWADQNQISYLAWSWKTDSIKSSTCIGSNIKSTNGTQMNQELLSNYNGGVNTVAPEPADIKAHLLATSWYLTAAKTLPSANSSSNLSAKNSQTSWLDNHHMLIGEILAAMAAIIIVCWVIIGLTKRRKGLQTSSRDGEAIQPTANPSETTLTPKTYDLKENKSDNHRQD